MAKKHSKEIKALGERIRSLREQQGYSIRDFAEICGIS
jgi:transcriptional regulator with XRE-family HTH domain